MLRNDIIKLLRKQKVAFDLDGTLLYTRRALTHAYLQAGARWVPNTPWTEFATPRQHAIKNNCYEEAVKNYAYRMPCFAWATRYSAPIITSASLDATMAINRVYPELEVTQSGCSIVEKIQALEYMNVCWYVDDDHEARGEIQEHTSVHVASPEVFIEIMGEL